MHRPASPAWIHVVLIRPLPVPPVLIIDVTESKAIVIGIWREPYLGKWLSRTILGVLNIYQLDRFVALLCI